MKPGNGKNQTRSRDPRKKREYYIHVRPRLGLLSKSVIKVNKAKIQRKRNQTLYITKFNFSCNKSEDNSVHLQICHLTVNEVLSRMILQQKKLSLPRLMLAEWSVQHCKGAPVGLVVFSSWLGRLLHKRYYVVTVPNKALLHSAYFLYLARGPKINFHNTLLTS